MSVKAILLSQFDPQNAGKSITAFTPTGTATLGRWDSVGVVEGETLASIGQEIQDRAGKTPSVRRTETLPVLRESGNGHAPPSRGEQKRESSVAAPAGTPAIKPLAPSAVRAHLLLRTRPGSTRAVCDRLVTLPESQHVYTVAGRYDIVATVGTQTIDEFGKLLEERVSAIEGIDSVETAMVVA